jgi:hypothetical protein
MPCSAHFVSYGVSALLLPGHRCSDASAPTPQLLAAALPSPPGVTAPRMYTRRSLSRCHAARHPCLVRRLGRARSGAGSRARRAPVGDATMSDWNKQSRKAARTLRAARIRFSKGLRFVLLLYSLIGSAHWNGTHRKLPRPRESSRFSSKAPARSVTSGRRVVCVLFELGGFLVLRRWP